MTPENTTPERETEHTPEPWGFFEEGVDLFVVDTPADREVGEDGKPWAYCPVATVEDQPKSEANAARIVACVNACEGMNPAAVPDLLAACKAVRENYTVATYDDGPEMYEVDGDTIGLVLDAIKKAEGGAA